MESKMHPVQLFTPDCDLYQPPSRPWRHVFTEITTIHKPFWMKCDTIVEDKVSFWEEVASSKSHNHCLVVWNIAFQPGVYFLERDQRFGTEIYASEMRINVSSSSRRKKTWQLCNSAAVVFFHFLLSHLPNHALISVFIKGRLQAFTSVAC